MNALLTTPLVERFVLQSLLLTAIGLALGRFLRSRDPGRTQGLLVAFQGASVLAPLLALWFREVAGWTVLPPASITLDLGQPETFLHSPVLLGELGGSLRAALLAFWALSSLIALLTLVRDGIDSRRLLRRCRPAPHDTQLAVDLERVLSTLGVQRQVKIFETRELSSPAICCWSRPARILLPPEFLRGSRQERLAVLLHEAAHLKRGDHWVSLACRLLCCAIPWNPLTWTLRRRIEDLSERDCDRRVLAAGGSPSTYARALLSFARPPSVATIALRATGPRRPPLSERIEFILKSSGKLSLPPRRPALWLACLLLGSAGFAALQRPAETRFRFLDPGSDETPLEWTGQRERNFFVREVDTSPSQGSEETRERQGRP